MSPRLDRAVISVLVLLFVGVLAGAATSQATAGPEDGGPSRPPPITSRDEVQRADPPGPPPPGPVHCVAEWEESEGVMIRWKYAPLIDAVQQRNLVYIPVNGPADQAEYESYLIAEGVPLTNIRWLSIKTNSIWTRDYGPWFVWDGNNEMGIVNYTPHYGPQDDDFPFNFARQHGIPWYESGLNHVGGNYYPNAYGMAFSSTYVYNENGTQTKATTDSLMESHYGITGYPTVSPQEIWHHDTWGKPADPETMIVVRFPLYSGGARPRSDNMAAWYETLESPWGRPYEIHRLPMFPKGAAYKPYMNSLVSNTTVYVGVDGGGTPDDLEALAVFEAAFPGYEIVGVPVDLYWWDAVHCRTRNFVKRDVIRMYPYPPGDSEDTVLGYEVRAEVVPPNGSSLLPGYPVIHWTETGTSPFSDVVMSPTGQPNEYVGTLPARPQGTTVSFYLEARDDGGVSAIYPLVAPDGMMSFEVRADTTPPELSRLTAPRVATDDHWPPTLRVLAKDDMATPDVWVEWEIDGTPQTDIPLTREEKTWWYGGTFGTASVGDLVTYRVKASDGAASPNIATLPRVGDAYLPVGASADVGVVDMSLRREAMPFFANALGGLSIPHDCYTEWPTDWSAHDLWIISLGVFPTNHILTTDQANDIVAALQAGKNVYLEGGDTWCYDAAKDILKPWFGVTELGRNTSPTMMAGEAGSMLDGMLLHYVGENCFMDTVGAEPGAELVLNSNDADGRAVTYDAGTYKAIASSACLAGLWDGHWPSTPKEILLRYLEFLGVARPQLVLGATAHSGSDVPLRLEGPPGHQYLLLFSLAEADLHAGAYGTLKLDPDWMFTLAAGTLPPEGLVSMDLPIPRDEAFLGLEIHFQGLVGTALEPLSSDLTNREIMRLVE
jgi:hypothetical protein